MRATHGLLPLFGVTWRYVLVVLAALAVVGCSQGNSSGSSSTDVDFGGSDDDAEAVEAEEADATPGADEGDGQATSSTSTTAPPSSGATDADVAAVEAEVERVIQRNWEIWVECTTDPETCDPAMALAETEVVTSPLYVESVGIVERWKLEGIAFRAVEGRPPDRFVEIRSIEVAPDLQSAEVVLCDRDDRARFQRDVDGNYQLVEGTDIGEDLLLRRVVVIDNGSWKISENELLDRRHVEEGIDPLC